MLQIVQEEMVQVSIEGPATEVAELQHWAHRTMRFRGLEVDTPVPDDPQWLRLTAVVTREDAARLQARATELHDPHLKLPAFSSALLGALNDRGGHALLPDVLPYVERLAQRQGTPAVAYVSGLERDGLLTASKIGPPPELVLELTDKGRAWLATEAARIAPGGVLKEDDPVHGTGGRGFVKLTPLEISLLETLINAEDSADALARRRVEIGSDVSVGLHGLKVKGLILPSGPEAYTVTTSGRAWREERARRAAAAARNPQAVQAYRDMEAQPERYPRGWHPDDERRG